MIRIEERHNYFQFRDEHFGGFWQSAKQCDFCGAELDARYVRIMEKLEKNGLIDEYEPLMCCRCRREYINSVDFGVSND